MYREGFQRDKEKEGRKRRKNSTEICSSRKIDRTENVNQANSSSGITERLDLSTYGPNKCFIVRRHLITRSIRKRIELERWKIEKKEYELEEGIDGI